MTTVRPLLGVPRNYPWRRGPARHPRCFTSFEDSDDEEEVTDDKSNHEVAKQILFGIGYDIDWPEVDKLTTDEINQRLLEINRGFLCTAEWDYEKVDEWDNEKEDDDARPGVARGAYEHPFHCPALRDHKGVRGTLPPSPPPTQFMTCLCALVVLLTIIVKSRMGC
jgi:hypothetical protein